MKITSIEAVKVVLPEGADGLEERLKRHTVVVDHAETRRDGEGTPLAFRARVA